MSRPVPPSVTVSDDGTAAGAALTGEFDMAAAFTVEPALDRAFRLPGLRRLTIDLSALSFIDSTGIGVLLRADEEARSRGFDLRLVPGPREVMRVFEVAGLVDVLPFVAPDDEDAA